eukprot:CAMPEP_0195295860 /NCGR_PEP_ID=MMETSP0707-20130614/18197_1 /TAXON_ID=33640 /ORGANISM="Asterionellopsis glacialis, Strain CCMP134" /LENGTH=576 /DNA_ID=CAMNT_0040357191 /DNA_START=24 /DNA_END=1751 /DNA_ORIENTATION=-
MNAAKIANGTMNTPRWGRIRSSLLLLIGLFGVRSAYAENCTFCAEGTNGEPFSSVDPPCIDLASQLFELEAVDDACIDIQLQTYESCGCLTLPIVRPSASPSQAPPSTSPSLSLEPTQTNCTICPDGSDLPFPDLAIITDFSDPDTIMTCEEMEQSSSMGCRGIRDYAAYCDCPGVEPPCTICPDGSPVPEPNLKIPFADMPNVTCGMYDLFVTQIFESDICDEFQTMLAGFCGCLDIEPNCLTMCSDGSFISEDYADVYLYTEDGVNVTCGDMELRANAGTLSESECHSAHYLGEMACGCTPQEDVCHICEDGSILPNLTLAAIAPFTCLELAGFAYDVSEDDQQCVASQGVDGVYCGCDNPTSSSKICRVCGDDNLLLDPNRRVTINGGEISCGDLEFSSNVLKTTCEFPNEETAACCVPETMSPAPSLSPSEVPPSPTCLLCGNMTAPGYPGVDIFLPGLGTFNCSELYDQGLNGKVTDTNCPLVQLIAASPCGCFKESLAPTHSPSLSQIPSDQPSDYPTEVPLPSAIPSEYPTESPTTTSSVSQAPTAESSGASRVWRNFLVPASLVMGLW